MSGMSDLHIDWYDNLDPVDQMDEDNRGDPQNMKCDKPVDEDEMRVLIEELKDGMVILFKSGNGDL